ncbi:MAG: hypothetical protein VYA11_07160 [Planctomycetota bacterium]|nr:hypothetical protein [Planctomycetota bacterium]
MSPLFEKNHNPEIPNCWVITASLAGNQSPVEVFCKTVHDERIENLFKWDRPGNVRSSRQRKNATGPACGLKKRVK